MEYVRVIEAWGEICKWFNHDCQLCGLKTCFHTSIKNPKQFEDTVQAIATTIGILKQRG